MVAVANLPTAYACASAEEALELSLGRQDLRELQKRADAAEEGPPRGAACAGKGLEVVLSAEAVTDPDLAAALMRVADEDALEVALAKRDLHDLQHRTDATETESLPRPCAQAPVAKKAAADGELLAAYALAAEVDALEASLAKRDLYELQRRADAAEASFATRPAADGDLAAAYARLAGEDLLELALAKRDMRELQHHADEAATTGTFPPAVTKLPATVEDLADAYMLITAEDVLETALAKQDLRSVQQRVDAAEAKAALAITTCLQMTAQRTADADLEAAYARIAAEDALEANLAASDMRGIQARADASEGLALAAAAACEEGQEAEASGDSSEELNFSPVKKRRVGDDWQRQVSDASTSAPDAWDRQVSESSTLAPGSPAMVC